MAEVSRGKRGTVRLDPTATIPEAAPLRFVEGEGAIEAADRADLAGAAAKPVKSPRKSATPESDRQEFASGALRQGPRGPTLELRKVDVSLADPRKMKTVKGRGLNYDPTLDADEPGEPVEQPSRAPLVIAVMGVAAFVVALLFLLKSRLGH
jgi:hypothetical protein